MKLEGFTNAEIALKFDVVERTVEREGQRGIQRSRTGVDGKRLAAIPEGPSQRSLGARHAAQLKLAARVEANWNSFV